MAGHIQDRWFKTETNANGKTVRVKTDRHGTGMRYRARYIGPDGTEKSKSFPTDRSDWLTSGLPTSKPTCLAVSTWTPPPVA